MKASVGENQRQRKKTARQAKEGESGHLEGTFMAHDIHAVPLRILLLTAPLTT